MKQAELVAHILNFVEVASVQLEVMFYSPSDPDYHLDDEGELKTTLLSAQETLSQWAQLPDCTYSPMFIGYLIGKGENIKTLAPIDVEMAVTVALTGSTKSMFIGGENASQVLN